MTQQKKFAPSKVVRGRYGDCCDMTLYRWSRDPKLGFPKPTKINGRLFWDLDDLDKWDAARARDTETAA